MTEIIIMIMIAKVIVLITYEGQLKNLTFPLSVYPQAPIMIKPASLPLILICLLIINHFPFHCNSIFVRLCFIQRGTPRCRIFRHSAIPPFRHSAIPPFRHSAFPPLHHSIEWRHPVELNVSYFGPCSLRKVSGSSEQLLLIEMVR